MYSLSATIVIAYHKKQTLQRHLFLFSLHYFIQHLKLDKNSFMEEEALCQFYVNVTYEFEGST